METKRYQIIKKEDEEIVMDLKIEINANYVTLVEHVHNIALTAIPAGKIVNVIADLELPEAVKLEIIQIVTEKQFGYMEIQRELADLKLKSLRINERLIKARLDVEDDTNEMKDALERAYIEFELSLIRIENVLKDFIKGK